MLLPKEGADCIAERHQVVVYKQKGKYVIRRKMVVVYVVVVCFDPVGQTLERLTRRLCWAWLSWQLPVVDILSGYPAERHLGLFYKERPNLQYFQVNLRWLCTCSPVVYFVTD